MVYSENCTDCLFSGNEPIIVVSESVCGDSIHCRFYAHVQFHQCNGVCEVQLLAFYMQSGCSCPDSQIIKEIMQKIVTRVPCNGNIVRLIAGGCWRHDYAETIGIFQPELLLMVLRLVVMVAVIILAIVVLVVERNMQLIVLAI